MLKEPDGLTNDFRVDLVAQIGDGRVPSVLYLGYAEVFRDALGNENHHERNAEDGPDVVIFVSKGVAEYFGVTEIQYAGHAAITNLRNQVYAKIIRQPIGFFQHHPAGRVLSAVINDIEKTRIALSEYLSDLFQKSFTLIVFIAVLFYIDL